MQGDVGKYLGASRTRSTVTVSASVSYLAVIFSMMLPQSAALLVAGMLWAATVTWWGASYVYWQRKIVRRALEESRRRERAAAAMGDVVLPRARDEPRVRVSEGVTLVFDSRVLDPCRDPVEPLQRAKGHSRRFRFKCIQCRRRWTPPQGVDARKTPCYACTAPAPHPLEIPVMKEESGATPGGDHGREEQRHDRSSDRRRDFPHGGRSRS